MNNGYILDASISPQLNFGHSPTGNFDLNGTGYANNAGIGEVGGGIQRDKDRNFTILSGGPSAGVQLNAGRLKSETKAMAIPFWSIIKMTLRRLW